MITEAATGRVALAVALELDDEGNLEASCTVCGHLAMVPGDEVAGTVKGVASHLQLHATVLRLAPRGLLEQLAGRG